MCRACQADIEVESCPSREGFYCHCFQNGFRLVIETPENHLECAKEGFLTGVNRILNTMPGERRVLDQWGTSKDKVNSMCQMICDIEVMKKMMTAHLAQETTKETIEENERMGRKILESRRKARRRQHKYYLAKKRTADKKVKAASSSSSKNVTAKRKREVVAVGKADIVGKKDKEEVTKKHKRRTRKRKAGDNKADDVASAKLLKELFGHLDDEVGTGEKPEAPVADESAAAAAAATVEDYPEQPRDMPTIVT